MDNLIDVISVVLFLALILYAGAKLDEASKRLHDEEDRVYGERKSK